MKISRAEMFAQYLVDHNATVRQTAKHFNISKSTVHGDISKKLPLLNPPLFRRAKCVMDYNYEVKHIRGGRATSLKYKHKKS